MVSSYSTNNYNRLCRGVLMYNARLIPPQDINKVWKFCFHFIEEAIETMSGLCSPEDIYNLLLNGNRQLWIVDKDGEVIGVVVTTINNDWRIKVLQIDICDGRDVKQWKHLISEVEEFGKQQGCDRIFMMARCGYERELKEFNYKKTHIFLEKEID